MCPTKPFTEPRSLNKPVERAEEGACWSTCDPSAAYAGRSTLVSLKTGAVKSRSWPSRSAKKARGSGGPCHSGSLGGRSAAAQGTVTSTTLVERHSRFVLLIKVRSRDTAEVVGALSKHVRKLPATLRRSLTWDRGLEMAKHKELRWPRM